MLLMNRRGQLVTNILKYSYLCVLYIELTSPNISLRGCEMVDRSRSQKNVICISYLDFSSVTAVCDNCHKP